MVAKAGNLIFMARDSRFFETLLTQVLLFLEQMAKNHSDFLVEDLGTLSVIL